jgi:hypothetical protein
MKRTAVPFAQILTAAALSLGCLSRERRNLYTLNIVGGGGSIVADRSPVWIAVGSQSNFGQWPYDCGFYESRFLTPEQFSKFLHGTLRPAHFPVRTDVFFGTRKFHIPFSAPATAGGGLVGLCGALFFFFKVVGFVGAKVKGSSGPVG